MKKDAIITISGLHKEHDSDTPIELNVCGEMLQTDHSTILRYTEYDEENNITKNCLRITETEIKITKSGNVETEMLLSLDMPFETEYRTPFGVIIAKTVTKSIRHSERGNSLINVTAEYDMYLNGEFSSGCVLNIVVTEAKEKQEIKKDSL